jgi:hypothetical protein
VETEADARFSLVEILLSWLLERNPVANRNLLGLGVGYLPNLFSFDFGQLADVQIHHLSDFAVAKDHVPMVIDCRTAPYRDRPCNRITSSLVSVPAEIKGGEQCDRGSFGIKENAIDREASQLLLETLPWSSLPTAVGIPDRRKPGPGDSDVGRTSHLSIEPLSSPDPIPGLD